MKLTTIRIVLALVARDDLYLEHMDVKTAFLHGDLEEKIYMMRPQGFEVTVKDKNGVQTSEELVCP